MQPINQTIVNKGRGDCMRAALASMFHLEIIQVPHFLLFGDRWFNVYWHFLLSLGYEYKGENVAENLDKAIPVNDCLYASVPSKTYKTGTHAVLIDVNGLVVHDPNPNKLWAGINVVESGELLYWQMIEKAEETKKY